MNDINLYNYPDQFIYRNLRTLLPEINRLKLKNVTNDHLKYLTNIKIRKLILISDLITDQGLIYLNGNNIQSIELNTSDITDRGALKYLYNFNQIKLINAHHITDEGIKNLVNVQALTIINCCKITDNAFRYLTKCLKKIMIKDCVKVTVNGVKYIKARHINLRYIMTIDDHDWRYFSDTHIITLPINIRMSSIGMRYLSNVKSICFVRGKPTKCNVFRYMIDTEEVRFIGCTPSILGAHYILMTNIQTIYTETLFLNEHGIKFLMNSGFRIVNTGDNFTKIQKY